MTRHKSIDELHSEAVERVLLPAPDVTAPYPAELPGASCDSHAANENGCDFGGEEPTQRDASTMRELTDAKLRELMGVG